MEKRLVISYEKKINFSKKNSKDFGIRFYLLKHSGVDIKSFEEIEFDDLLVIGDRGTSNE